MGMAAIAALTVGAPAMAQTPTRDVSIVEPRAFRPGENLARQQTAQTPAPAAQTPAGQAAPVSAARRVEFDAAVQQAIDRNPTVASAATAITQANALLQQARAAIMPALAASLMNNTLDSARGFSGGITQPRNQTTIAASATWNVLDATSWADVAHARDEIQVSTFSSAETRREIAVSAAQAYLAVIAAHRQLEVDERALANARAHLTYAQQRLNGGVGTRLDELRAAQEAAGDEARLENSRFALAQSQEALGVLLADPGPVDSGAEPTFDLPATITEADWANRPDVRAQVASINAAERVVHDSWKQWLPSAGVSFTPQYVTPSGLFAPSRTWVFSIGVTQRIFDPSYRATTALKRVDLDRAELARQSLETEIRSEVRLAQEAVASYERARASAREASDQAAEVLRVATAAFQLGATTNLEVIDAERTARDAESTATIADDAWRRARLNLLVALGRFPH
jgi:outer membrane protein TolC